MVLSIHRALFESIQCCYVITVSVFMSWTIGFRDLLKQPNPEIFENTWKFLSKRSSQILSNEHEKYSNFIMKHETKYLKSCSLQWKYLLQNFLTLPKFKHPGPMVFIASRSGPHNQPYLHRKGDMSIQNYSVRMLKTAHMQLHNQTIKFHVPF